MIPEVGVAEAAERVLAALEGMTVDALRALAAGLGFAGKRFALLAQSVDYYADVVEFESGDGLAELAMRVALKRGALDDELLDQLAGAQGTFWVVIRDALLKLRDAAGEAGGRSR